MDTDTSFLDGLVEWRNLQGSGTAELLLDLLSEDNNTQRVASEALDYTLLSLGADIPENYGNPQLLLKSNVLLDVVPVLVKIADVEISNWLGKWCALNLLYNIHNFCTVESTIRYDTQKAELIRNSVIAHKAVYERLREHDDQNVRNMADDLLELLQSPS